MAEQPAPRKKSIRRWLPSCLAVGLVTLLALGLGLYHLEAKSLWHDEFGTLSCASWQGSWLGAIRGPLTIPTLPKPPLYFVLTHLALMLDASVFAARLPAALFATLTVPLLYLAGRSLLGRRAGLLAALLLAVAPLHIRYAQEARMYSLLAALSTLSLYLFWRAVTTGKGRWWLGFVLASSLNLYTHQFALLPLGVMALFGIWLLLRRRARVSFPFRGWHLIASLAAIGLLTLPLVPYLVEGVLSEEGLGGAATAVYGELRWNVASLVATLRLFSGGNGVGLAVYALLFVLGLVALRVRAHRARRPLDQGSPVTAEDPAAARQRQRTRYALLLLLLWLVLPPIISLSIPAGHGMRIRYLLFMLPVYLLLVAYGLEAVIRWLAPAVRAYRPTLSRGAASALGALILLGLLAGIAGPTVAAYYAETRQDWQAATTLVEASAGVGEPVFVSRRHHQTGVRFYGDLRAEGPGPLLDDVQLLPKEPGRDLLPPEADRGWLILPVREEYLPGGALEVQLAPYYHLGEVTYFDASGVPQDSSLIAPIAYRSLAVIQVTRIQPLSIHFAADAEAIPRGSCTWLRWDVEHVRAVYLDGEGVVGHGEREVCPAATTAFALRVVHTDDTASTTTIEIQVIAP